MHDSGLSCFVTTLLVGSLNHSYGQNKELADSLELVLKNRNVHGIDRLALLKELAENTTVHSRRMEVSKLLIEEAEVQGSNIHVFSGYLEIGHTYRFER